MDLETIFFKGFFAGQAETPVLDKLAANLGDGAEMPVLDKLAANLGYGVAGGYDSDAGMSIIDQYRLSKQAAEGDAWGRETPGARRDPRDAARKPGFFGRAAGRIGRAASAVGEAARSAPGKAGSLAGKLTGISDIRQALIQRAHMKQFPKQDNEAIARMARSNLLRGAGKAALTTGALAAGGYGIKKLVDWRRKKKQGIVPPEKKEETAQGAQE